MNRTVFTLNRRPRWTPLIATAKLALGELTHDWWLQLEGSRLKYPELLNNNKAFAQVRNLTREPESRAAPSL